MKVTLVNMPWGPIDVPSLALGILRTAVRRAVPGIDVEVVHANLDFVDWITGRYAFNGHDYLYFSLSTYFRGIGDWVFSSALYDDPEWRLEAMVEQLGEDATDAELAVNQDLHAMVPEFVRTTARALVDSGADVVGFTSTFQQNVAALATAREVKRIAPHVVTVFGGPNCEGAQGAALHRNFPFVDLVVRGEGERVFPAVLRALSGDRDLAGVPGLCWRDGDRSVANPMASVPLPPAEIVPPDYDGYFERLGDSRARTWVEPKLVVEGARGCWWGEKHHCTFCGLNGSFMQFRSKSPGAFFAEIMDMVRRHQVLDMYVVDNILDMGYLGSLLPMLVEAGCDLRLQYEIKSNLRRHQLRTLAEAGIVQVQPGIESLDSRVLKLMDKGVTGCQNVRMLRDAVSCGLSVSWNYLYGFPGETDEDYRPVLAQLPALHHLEPPSGATRIAIERFSPYFDRPELGFVDLRPNPQYRMTYDLPEAELGDLAYLFDAPAQGIGPAVETALDEAVAAWAMAYFDSRLSHCDVGTEIVVVNRRPGFDWSVLRLAADLDKAVFRLLDQPHGVPGLLRALARQGLGGVPETELTALLADWSRLGLVFTDDGQYVQVAPEATNQDLLHVDPRDLLGFAGPDPEADPADTVPLAVPVVS